MTGFFKKIKTLLLSYPDREYVDWKIAELKQAVMENDLAPILRRNMLYSKEPGVSPERCCGEELIVSLTTYGQRIHGVGMTIETLMEQSVKPNRIILNLGLEFERRGMIPGSVKLLERRGLEIRFVRDRGPYTKLLPTLSDNPEATIITVDDDILYDMDLVSDLVNEHINHPSEIIASRCRVMDVDDGGRLRSPFLTWGFAGNGDAGMGLLPEGVRGILYPPDSLDGRVFDGELSGRLCPTTDDFWFKAMSMLKGVPVRKCYSLDSRVNLNNSVTDTYDTLHRRNAAGGYDSQLQAVLSHFGLK